jgi:hypothetical protein
MAATENPNKDRDSNRQTPDPPPAEPTRPGHVRPMDDPGRGHGDKFEEQLPGHDHPDRDRNQ